MEGLVRFLRKELKEMARTWRLPTLGGVAVFFALTGPILALLTPELLASMQDAQAGVVILIPDPTWRDAYAQWLKNLSQIVTFVAIIAAAGSVAGEVASGTALLVLTKPVSRTSFVAAKALALFALVASVTLAGTAITQAVTWAVFGTAPTAELWLPTLVWLASAGVLVAIATMLSAILPTLAAAGVGVAVFFGLALLGYWGPAVTYSPVGLLTAPGEMLSGAEPPLLWPLATAVVVAVAAIAVGGALFSRREL